MKKHRHHATLFLLLLLPSILAAVAQAQAQAQPNESDPNLSRFNPSLAVIIVILVAALFVMAIFSIYVRHCADTPSNSVRPLTAARSRRLARGLDPAVIQTFPILEYSEVKIHKIGKEALECAVCLCEFEDSETLRLIPKCDHVFHPECIDEWLSSHTTCPVCRANLVPTESQDSEANNGVAAVPDPQPSDVEAQNDAVEAPPEQQNADSDRYLTEPEVLSLEKTLNRNRTRGSRSNRRGRFSKSHSTGHSIVQPGENTDRFTLRLPLEVRKQVINRQLNRASSLIVLPREGSSRQGYRTGEGSSRGKHSRRLDRGLKSDRWIFSKAAPFFARALSIRSPRTRNNDVEGTPSSSSTAPIMPRTAVDSARPPV